MSEYEFAIIGGGPAGVAAAIYAARRKMKLVVFEAEIIGGQLNEAHSIENYPGIISISGLELSGVFEKQLEKLGVEIKHIKVIDINKENEGFVLSCSDNNKYTAKTILIATGAKHRKLNAKGEDKFLGRGISYCVSCDAPLFTDKVVAVIGGGNSAVLGGIVLSDICKKVYQIHRREGFRAAEINLDMLKARENIELKPNYVIDEFKGDKMLNKIVLKNTKTLELEELEVDGCFIEVGIVPSAELVKNIGVEIDEKGYIKVNRNTETNVPGIYSAGDITRNIMQIASAVSEGATAAIAAYKMLHGE